MNRARLRATVAGIGASAMAIGGGAVFAGTAAAATGHVAGQSSHARGDRDDHGRHRDRRALLSAPLAASEPADPAIFGVTPGKLPWAMKSGYVVLRADGQVKAEVRGLVVPATHKNPLPELSAVVFCNGGEVGYTAPVRFTAKGNAKVSKRVTLPALCAAPAVLLEPVKGSMPAGMYIAFDGKAMS